MIREKVGILAILLCMIFLSCASSEEFAANSGQLSEPGPLVLPYVTASDANAGGRAITASIETAAEMMGRADQRATSEDSDLLTGMIKSGPVPESVQNLFLLNNSGNTGLLAAPTAKLSISGMVFNDLNGDGLRTNDEPVLPGWETILTQDEKEILRTTTDNEGRYSFQNLASGQYTVVVINQSGWNRTHPTSGRYEINLVEINATNYDFGVHLGPVTFVQSEYPLMPMELAFSDAKAFETAPKFEVKPETQTMLKEAAGEHFSLLGNLQYTASDRTQYSCGNCWVWAGTACLENAMTVQEGVKNRLSAQYFVSNYNGGTGSWACCGGTATEFANYYANTLKKAIPWTNTNADWRDSYQGCSGSTTTPASTIGTTPNYPITSITAQGIDTVGVGEANAIANIKAALKQNKMVHFAFWMPSSAGWTQFSTFWNGDSGIYNPDGYCGQSASTGANGHAVACVGWDDASSDPNQHYWIMLNSWGAPSAHPDGTFKVKMHMNYDCLYPSWTYAHRFWTYDVAFGATPSTWTKLGGYLTSKHSAITDNQGRRHVFAIGGDNALWDNVDGSWSSLGGSLTSAPYAAKDKNGKIHIVARGGDNALWDFVFDTASWTGGWRGLGGSLNSLATAAMEPTYGVWMKIVVLGNDNSLWLCEFNVNDLTTRNWIGYGGNLASWPYVMFDLNSRMHTFVRGADNALWDNRGVLSSGSYVNNWHRLGGAIQGAPFSTLEPGYSSYLAAMVRGTDNALWMADINGMSDPETCSWRGFGGVFGSEPFVSTDTSGRIHTFVRGGDSAMWEHVFSSNPWNPAGAQWRGHGGSISWSPQALLDGQTYAYVLGTDSAIWRKVYTTSAPSSSAAEASGKVDNPVEPMTLMEGATGASKA